MDEYRRANRSMWNERVPIHLKSEFYDLPGFLAGESSLRAFEREDLPDVAGRSLVHLQCHFGLDTLSWARLGARVTGLDFSEPAVEAAREVAQRTGLEAEFVVSDVYDALTALENRRFDIVYTGLGALCWLPDIEGWADVVRGLLAPGGTFYLPEFHPLSDILGDEDFAVERAYFQGGEPERWEGTGSYADLGADTEANVSYEWVHPLSEVIDALLRRGLVLDRFREMDYTLFPRWPFLVHDPAHGRDTYRLPADKPRVPLMYALRFRAPAASTSRDAGA